MMPMQGMQPNNSQALLQRLMQMRQQGGGSNAPMPNGPAPVTPGNAAPMATANNMPQGQPPMQPQPAMQGAMAPNPDMIRKLMMMRQQQQMQNGGQGMPGAGPGVNGAPNPMMRPMGQ